MPKPFITEDKWLAGATPSGPDDITSFPICIVDFKYVPVARTTALALWNAPKFVNTPSTFPSLTLISTISPCFKYKFSVFSIWNYIYSW